MKKILILIILIGLFSGQQVQAKTDPFTDYIKKITETSLEIVENIPEEVKIIFEEQALPIWEEMYEWFEENIWNTIKPLTEKEIERRKEIAGEELIKEKEELIGELTNQNTFLNKIIDFFGNFWE